MSYVTAVLLLYMPKVACFQCLASLLNRSFYFEFYRFQVVKREGKYLCVCVSIAEVVPFFRFAGKANPAPFAVVRHFVSALPAKIARAFQERRDPP